MNHETPWVTSTGMRGVRQVLRRVICGNLRESRYDSYALADFLVLGGIAQAKAFLLAVGR